MNAWLVARKELRDHLRDGRALLSSASMALLGPGVVLLISLSERGRGPDSGPVLLGMLSVFALVASFAGAIDIAMDSTAGERERRCLVPLLLNPVARSQFVIGKWIAVTIFALGALGLNVLGLFAVLATAVPDLLISKMPVLVQWIVLGLVPLTAFGAAVNLLIALMCRTTKEAHGALRFLAFVPMLVGMFLVFFPSWAGQRWFLLPVLGQQALISLGESPAAWLQSVILATVTCAAVVPLLGWATALMNHDGMLSA